jgi:ABC-type uncharacterized transport system permease subunit
MSNAMQSIRENPVGTILKLLLLCLVVGLLLTFFDITPQHIFHDTLRTVGEIWDLISRLVRWAVPYILMGAVVVVPVAIISVVVRARR